LPGFLAASAPGEHLDAIGDHERRIEAHAELADQARAFRALGGFDPLHECFRS
jgi:hypothetical protein